MSTMTCQPLMLELLKQGFSVLAVHPENKTPYGKWEAYQHQPMTPEEATAKIKPYTKAFALIGYVNGVEIIDFDADKNQTCSYTYDIKHVFRTFLEELKHAIAAQELAPLETHSTLKPTGYTHPNVETGEPETELEEVEVFTQLYLQETQGGGVHLVVRWDDNEVIEGNQKLFSQPLKPEHAKVKNQSHALIETRGRGGYALMHPSKGYTPLPESTDLLSLKPLSVAYREVFLNTARTMHHVLGLERNTAFESDRERQVQEAFNRHPSNQAPTLTGSQNVFELFRESYDLDTLLHSHGYNPVGSQYLCPNSTSKQAGVWLNDERTLLFSHHSSDPLGDGKAHDAFDAYAILEHGGDKKAARAQILVDHPEWKALIAPERQPRSQPDHADKKQHIYATREGFWLRKEDAEGNETAQLLTNWTYTPTHLLVRQNGMFNEYGTFTTNTGRSLDLIVESEIWASRGHLAKFVVTFGGVVLFSQHDKAAHLRKYILDTHTNVPSKYGVPYYGLHKDSEGAWHGLYADTPINDTPYFYDSNVTIHSSKQAYDAPPTTLDPINLDALKHLVNLNNNAVMTALIAYAAFAPLAPRLTPTLGCLPFIGLTAERATGKTTIGRYLMLLANGRDAREYKASGMSTFQYHQAVGQTNNLLTLIDEFRLGCFKYNDEDNNIRSHYDMEVKERGTGNIEHKLKHHLLSPTIFSGEGFTEDPATRSRLLHFRLSKVDRNEDAQQQIQPRDLIPMATQLHRLAQDLPEDTLERWTKQAQTLANEYPVDARTKTNMLALIVGFEFITHALECRHVLQTDLLLEALDLITSAEVDEGRTQLSDFERFLVELSSSMGSAKDTELLSMIKVSPFDEPIIRVDEAVKFLQAQRSVTFHLNANQLKKLALESELVIKGSGKGENVHKTRFKKAVRGLRLDTKSILFRETLDCDSLLEDAVFRVIHLLEDKNSVFPPLRNGF